MIGGLDDFGHVIPSKHMERLVDFHSLLRQRCRSLFLSLPALNMDVVREGVYQLLVHILAQNYGIFDIIQPKLNDSDSEFWRILRIVRLKSKLN